MSDNKDNKEKKSSFLADIKGFHVMIVATIAVVVGDVMKHKYSQKKIIYRPPTIYRSIRQKPFVSKRFKKY